MMNNFPPQLSSGCSIGWQTKQEGAVLAMEDAGDTILVKWGNFHFTSFSDQDEFLDFISECKEEERQFFEVLRENKPQLMFADLDGEGLSITRIQLYEEWESLMKRVFNDTGLTFKQSNVRLLNSTGDKISGHWSYLGLSFKNSEEQKEFWLYVDFIIERDYPQLCFLRKRADEKLELMNVLDIAVYSKNRAMRTIYSHKSGSDRVLKPCKLKVGCNPTLVSLKQYNPADYLIFTPDATEFYNLKIPKFEKLKHKFLTQDDIQKLILQYVPNVEISEVSGRMFKLRNVGTRVCIINGEENISDNSYVIWKRDGLYFGCHDSGCNGQLKNICKLGVIVEQGSKTNWETLRIQASTVINDEQMNACISDVIDYMNTKYTAVLEGSRMIVIYNRDGAVCPVNAITGLIERDVMMLTKDSLGDFLASKEMPTQIILPSGVPATIRPFTVWWKSAKRNEKEKIVFEPFPENGTEPRTALTSYNLWDGYAIKYSSCQDVKKAELDTSPFLQHLFKRWCKSNTEIYNFLMGWIAKTIQHPEIKLRSAIVIKGKEGSCKGQVLELISRIIGERYFFQPSGPDEILGNWNSGMSGKKLIFLDECVWGGDKQKSGTLKKLITEDRYTVKTKFLPDYVLKNVMNLMMASNEEWCVPAGTNARRYLVLEILNDLAGLNKKNDTILKEIIKEINTPNDVLALAKTFYEWDLSNFNDRRPPQTEGLRTQKIHSFSNCQRFILTALNNGAIGKFSFGSLVPKNDIFQLFKDEYKDKHTPLKIFWDNVADMIGGEYNKTKPRKIDGESKRCVPLPTLEQARTTFKLYVGDEDWTFDILEDEPEESDEE